MVKLSPENETMLDIDQCLEHSLSDPRNFNRIADMVANHMVFAWIVSHIKSGDTNRDLCKLARELFVERRRTLRRLPVEELEASYQAISQGYITRL